MLAYLPHGVEDGKERILTAHVPLGAELYYSVCKSDGGSCATDASRAMHYSALVALRLQTPLDKVVEHELEVVHRILRLRDAVVGPARKMNLCDVVSGAVRPRSHDIPPCQVGTRLCLLR